MACSGFATVIQGVVLDEETGNALARTSVSLIPLPGSRMGTIAVRSGDRGAFAINNVGPGWYVLRCTRKGFVAAEVGQLRPGRPGMPFEITPDAQSSFFQIKMRRLGAVTGAVLDENNVGIPDWPVNVYTAHKPVRRIAEGRTDDRGNYRVGELESGSYVVRSGPGQLEDESHLLPTWYKFGTALENAEAVRVKVGETTSDLALRPVRGRLINLSGVLVSSFAATLTLVTDTGRHPLASGAGASFTYAVAPGEVEFLAEGTGGTGGRCGGYLRMFADHDMQGIRVACSPLGASFVNWSGNPDGRHFPVMMRRVDLDGEGPTQGVREQERITPGHWEFQAQPDEAYYVRSIGSELSSHPESTHDGWFEIDVGGAAQILVTLSNRPASLTGVVTTGSKPVVGAPVYLEMFDERLPNPRVRMLEMRSDAQGNYRFSGLAPGTYRVLSSFDFDPEDRFLLGKATVLTLRETDNATQALELMLP